MYICIVEPDIAWQKNAMGWEGCIFWATNGLGIAPDKALFFFFFQLKIADIFLLSLQINMLQMLIRSISVRHF